MLLSMENVETQNSPRDSAPYDYFCVAIVTRKYSGSEWELVDVRKGNAAICRGSPRSADPAPGCQATRGLFQPPEFVGGLIIKLPTFRATEIESCSPRS
jgi:hypothetical protein